MPAPKPSPPKPGINAAAIALIVEELGALEYRLLPHKPAMQRAETLRAALRSHYDESPADAMFEAGSDHYVAVVGARALTRAIDFPRLIKAIGLKAYSAIARCTLGALEEACTPQTVAAVVSAANTGARSIKTFPRPPV